MGHAWGLTVMQALMGNSKFSVQGLRIWVCPPPPAAMQIVTSPVVVQPWRIQPVTVSNQLALSSDFPNTASNQTTVDMHTHVDLVR